MKDNWKRIKEPLSSTCQEVPGHKKHHHKEWISMETPHMIQERKNKKTTINNSQTRTEKVNAQAQYTEANKRVKRSIRADEQKYVGDLTTTEEKIAIEENMRQLYHTKKKLTGNFIKPETPVKNKEGRSSTENQEQQDSWVEQLEEPLNRPDPPDFKAAPTDLPIGVTPPTTE
ncbi:unnamed protein product [Schistosoma curassoni]|uniref:Uncharacterized protein n=1 Tax=Schistosoma curassoni TaxID=6186 RepID=A0A183K1I0_9TREM|nr:unnamed protein product [Schistosoma curassoni]